LREAVESLEKSLDRAAERTEAARRAEARKRLEALVSNAGRNIYAGVEREQRQQERERFERKLFGTRLPRNFRERIFGFDDEGAKS
jgi:hypothetical protein